MRNGISIIRSIKEPSDVAENFIKALDGEGIECNLCYAEELIFSNFSYIGKKLKQIIYLFSNIESINILASLLQHNHKTVINFDYFRNNFSKEIIQLLLFQNGFKIPQNYFSQEISQLSKIKSDLFFPLLLKSLRHNEKQHALDSYSDYMKFISQMWIERPVYVEKYLNSDNYTVFKAYGIGKMIYFNSFGNQIQTLQLMEDLRSIGSIFSLEIYSVDCIFNLKDNKVFFIDVNPSPAFGQSEDAYNCFVQYLKMKNS